MKSMAVEILKPNLSAYEKKLRLLKFLRKTKKPGKIRLFVNSKQDFQED